jgi:hypothetical protein
MNGMTRLSTALLALCHDTGPGGGEARSLKVDILTGPEPTLRSIEIKTKDRRSYPKPKINLHARTLDEVLTATGKLDRHRRIGQPAT